MESTQLTKHLKLPFQFNVQKLKSELESLLKTKWIPHFNADGYDGEWNSIALYAQDGDESNISADPNVSSTLKETPILNNSKYLKKVIEQIKCPLLSVRLLRLGKGAFIKPHRDYNLGYENNNFRIHIPIITNQQVSFILDGIKLNMEEGQCWYTNVNYIHSVSNNGESDRIHLVIDCERNEWSDRLFFSMAPESSFFPKEKNNYSLDMMKNMIEELKLINTAGAKETIEELLSKIKTIEST